MEGWGGGVGEREWVGGGSGWGQRWVISSRRVMLACLPLRSLERGSAWARLKMSRLIKKCACVYVCVHVCVCTCVCVCVCVFVEESERVRTRELKKTRLSAVLLDTNLRLWSILAYLA